MSTTVTSPQIPEELQKRVEAASKVMGLTTDQLWEKLDELGIEKSEEGLSILNSDTTTELDAKPIFVEGCDIQSDGSGTPRVKIAKFRAGWAVLKGKIKTEVKEENGVSAIVEALKSVDQMPDEKLLEKYAQQGQDCIDTVLNRLRNITHGRPFVIFDFETDQINIPETLKLLRLARRQDTPSTWPYDHPKGRAVARPAALGEFPNVWFEECPIHGKILADGYCDSCEQSWKKVSPEVRVFIRVASDLGVIGKTYDVIKKLIETASDFEGLKLTFQPSVGLKYQELKEENKLPILRRKASKSKVADPFGHKTY